MSNYLFVWLPCLAALAASCDVPPPSASPPPLADAADTAQTADAPEPAEVTPPPATYTVHEWGTFTSIAASSGDLLGGAQHDEEALGATIHRRDVGVEGSGAAEVVTALVTQKLQTPVLFFHSDSALQVKLEAGFPLGLLDGWYPATAGFQPPIGGIQGLGGGSLAWTLELAPGAEPDQPVSDNTLWSALRQVDTTPVKVGGEVERFVFYRGLGSIQGPVRLQAFDDGNMKVTNVSPYTLPGAWMVWVHENGGKMVRVDSIAPYGHQLFSGTPKEVPIDFQNNARAILTGALEEVGLTPMEAQAAVAGAEHNFFKTYGVRLLYLAPEPWLDETFPLKLDPAPVDRVRAVVGRIELLPPASEMEVVTAVEAAFPTQDTSLLGKLGFFAEAKLRRAQKLITDPEVGAFCGELVALAAKGSAAWGTR
jgi:hypothetical protein